MAYLIFGQLIDDRDFTFTPKTFGNDNMLLFLNEYRQAFKNGFLTLDTGYTEGYKEIPLQKKLSGSRSHVFIDSNFRLFSRMKIKTYESSLFTTKFKERLMIHILEFTI